MDSQPHHLPEPSDDDIARIKRLYNRCDPRHDIVISAKDVFEVLKLEHQMRAEQEATKRALIVSWTLAGATVALVLATIALVLA